MRHLALIASLLAAGCVGSGDIEATLGGQIVGVDGGPLGPGLVMVERGPVHDGTYRAGVQIPEDGRFSMTLSSGGTWGIHLFHDDYQYIPLEVTIEDHQQVTLNSLNVPWGVWMDMTGQPTWPRQPDDDRLVRMPYDENTGDNPSLSNIRMTPIGGGLLQVEVDAFDPDGDLSRMVLMYDATTGSGYALNPPEPPDQRGRYPNGTYSRKIYINEAHVPGESLFYFVTADNMCNNSPVIEYVMPR